MAVTTPEAITGLSCYDVIGDIAPAVDAVLASRNLGYFAVGGAVTAALTHPETIIDPIGRVVIPLQAASPSLRRPENGTLRDIEFIIKGVPTKELSVEVRDAATRAIDGQLVVAVSGFEARNPHRRLIDRVKETTLTGCTSRRTVDAEGEMYYEMFPLEKQVDPRSYDTRTLLLPNGKSLPMLHPVGHTAAYDLRSVSGPRPKDAEKVDHMRQRIYPMFKSEINDGPFSGWFDFINEGTLLRVFGAAAEVTTNAQATFHNMNMYRTRAQVLSKLEKHAKLVELAQGVLRPILDRFIQAT